MKNQPVKFEEKQARAEEIAKILGDNKRWHSHGRSIGIQTLQNELKLKIEDFSEIVDLRNLIRKYNDMICDYIVRTKRPYFLQSRNHF